VLNRQEASLKRNNETVLPDRFQTPQMGQDHLVISRRTFKSDREFLLAHRITGPLVDFADRSRSHFRLLPYIPTSGEGVARQ